MGADLYTNTDLNYTMYQYVGNNVNISGDCYSVEVIECGNYDYQKIEIPYLIGSGNYIPLVYTDCNCDTQIILLDIYDDYTIPPFTTPTPTPTSQPTPTPSSTPFPTPTPSATIGTYTYYYQVRDCNDPLNIRIFGSNTFYPLGRIVKGYIFPDCFEIINEYLTPQTPEDQINPAKIYL